MIFFFFLKGQNDGVGVSQVIKMLGSNSQGRYRHEQTTVGGNMAHFQGQTADDQGDCNVEFTSGHRGVMGHPPLAERKGQGLMMRGLDLGKNLKALSWEQQKSSKDLNSRVTQSNLCP